MVMHEQRTIASPKVIKLKCFICRLFQETDIKNAGCLLALN